MTSLPSNPEDCVGLIIALRPGSEPFRVSTFGTEGYVFTLAEQQSYHKTLADRIRMFPVDQYPNGMVHYLPTFMGYSKLWDLFHVIGSVKDTVPKV